MFFLNNDKINILESTYLAQLEGDFPKWVAVVANRDNQSINEIREVNFDQNAFSFLDDIEKKNLIFRGTKNSKFKKNYQKAKDLTSISFASIGQKIIEDFKDFALTDPHKEDINYEGEARAHEWLRVSLTVLKKALLDASEQRNSLDKEIQFQGQLFYGIHPQKKNKHLKIVAFNLDLEFTMLEDSGLSINILETGKSEQSAKKYTQIIYRMKPQITDEIIGLLNDFIKALGL